MNETRVCCWVAGFAAALLACEGDEAVVHEDEGAVCLSQSADELQAVVPLGGCLSGSCDINRQSECSIELQADAIRVHSRFSYLRKAGSCTTDCGILAAHCTMPLPAIGTYAVLLGDQGGEITLPLGEKPTNAFPTEGGPGSNPCSLFPRFDFDPRNP